MQSGSIAGAAVAGLYVTLTIVWHSFRYEPDKAWLFAVLAGVCLSLAIQIVPAAWQSISNFVKAAGITLVLLGSAANFWFQSVYLPENTQEGIQYAVSVNSVVKSGSGWIAMLDFTMENQSSVTAITLGTMVIVRELVFPANHAVVPSGTAQYNINNYAKDLFIKNATATWAAAPDPNIGTSGNDQPKILTIIQPIGNNSDLHPNDTVGREFDVVIPPIPPNKVAALEVQWHVLYARSTRLLHSATITVPLLMRHPNIAAIMNSPPGLLTKAPWFALPEVVRYFIQSGARIYNILLSTRAFRRPRDHSKRRRSRPK